MKKIYPFHACCPLNRLFSIKLHLSALFCSMLIVLLYSIGLISYDRVVGYSTSFIGHSGLLGLFIIAILATIILAYIITFLFMWIDKLPINTTQSPPSYKRYFVGLLLFWLPVFLIRFPGNFDPDTFDQICMGYGIIPASDHHPWLDTLIFTGAWKLGDIIHSHYIALFLYTVTQILLTATLFAYVLCWMDHHHVPSIIRSASFWFFALFQFIPMLAQAMAKDMVHGLFFIAFYMFFIDIVKTRGVILSSHRFCIFFILASLFMTLTKKTGIYLFIPALVFSLIYINKKRILLLFLSITVVSGWICWHSILLPLWHVEKGELGEMMFIPSQQISYLVHNRSEELTEEDWQILEGVYSSPQTIADRYFPLRADAARSHWKEDASREELSSFANWYLKAWIRWPFSMLESWAADHFPLLCIDTNNTAFDESLLFYRNNLPQQGTHLGDPAKDSLFEKVYRNSWQSDLITSFDKIYLHLTSCLPVLFSKVLYAVWLPLIVLMYAFHKRSIQLFIYLVPTLLNTATLTLTSIVVPRYMLISIYCLPILLALPFLISEPNSTINGCTIEKQIASNCSAI